MSDSTQTRVLVVEDERIVALDLKRLLLKIGYRFLGSVSSGEEALDAASLQQPDVVLMDIMLLGNIDGIQAAGKIVSELEIPVIFCSGNADMATIERARGARSYGFLVKPIKESDLRATIEIALAKHENERRLKEHERLLSTILAGISDAVFAVDKTGHVAFMNPVAERLTKWRASEAIGSHLSAILSLAGDGGETVLLPASGRVDGGSVLPGAPAVWVIGRDGKKTPVEYSLSPLCTGEAQDGGSVVVVRDVTERRHYELDRIKSERDYHRLFEEAHDAILIFSPEREVVLEVNHRACAVYGYSRAEFIGMSLEDISVNTARGKEMIQRLLPGAMPVRFETKQRRKDGSLMFLEVHASVVQYQNVTAILSINRDITERKQYEDELRRSKEDLRNLARHLQEVRENERRQVAREVHDELGQVLFALKMETTVLQRNVARMEGGGLVADIDSILRLVDSSMTSVRRIITDLRPEVLDELGIGEALDWLAGEFERRWRIPCRIDRRDTIPDLDELTTTALFRICQEALTNVARHARATRALVTLSLDGSSVLLSIADDGVGMDPDALRRKESFGFLGIRERAELLGGSMNLESAPGKGTMLRVRIPLKPENGTPGGDKKMMSF